MKPIYQAPRFRVITDSELRGTIDAAAWSCHCFFKFCWPTS